jgi:hypothetical protein
MKPTSLEESNFANRVSVEEVEEGTALAPKFDGDAPNPTQL